MSLSILDQSVPEINTPILQSTLHKLIPKALKDLASEATAKAKKKINDFADWLMSYRKVSEIIQKILNLYSNPKVKLLKKALKGFKKSYEVGIISNDPLEQLTNTRTIVSNYMPKGHLSY